MKLRKLGILGLSASMIGATEMALANTGVKEVKADEQPELKLTYQQEKFLDMFAHKMNEGKDDYYAYLDAWYKDPNGENGLTYFNEFDETKTDFSAEEIEIAKKSIYFDTIAVFYYAQDKLCNIDKTTMTLDHIMSIKNDILCVVDNLSVENIQPGSVTARDLCRSANNIYQLITDTWIDATDISLEPDQEDLKYFIVYYGQKLWLQSQSEYLAGNTDKTKDSYNIYKDMVDKTALFTHYDKNAIQNVLDNFIDNLLETNDANDLLGYDESAILNWFYDEPSIEQHHDEIMTGFNNSLNMVFYYFKTIQCIEEFCPSNFNGFSQVFNNLGPSMYKLVEYLEAVKGWEEDPTGNPGVYTPDYENAMLISLYLYEDIQNFLKSFTDDCMDVVYENLSAEVEDLNDEFVDFANTKIDSIETYDAVDQGLKLIFSDLIVLVDRVKMYADYYLNQDFKDLEIEVNLFALQALDTLLEKHDDIMNLIDNEINAIIDSINGQADLIYSLMDEDNSDVRKLLEEALDLPTQLSRVVITLGEYEQILGSESVLDALMEKEEMEYAKVSALIDNLRGLQKERAIESIASRGTGLVEGATYLVENEGTVRECDAFIEQIEVLIREIDDNYEILGQDERLSQTKAKLNESLNDLNELKDSINSAHTRNIVLIVVGSVIGAALFFVGGFFLSKLLATKKRKEA